MNNIFNSFDTKFTNFVEKNYNKIFLFTIILFAVAIRLLVIPWQTGDYVIHLRDWFLVFEEHGISGFKYIYSEAKSNYSPLYMFILYFLSLLPKFSIDIYNELNIIAYIKLVSIIFDFCIAFITYKIIKEYNKKDYVALLAFASILFSPLVFFNASFWGQADGIYTFFIILALFYLYKKNNLKALIFYGISFAFKLQAVFILPLFIILYFKRYFSIKYFLLIPIPHLLFSILASLFGSSFMDAFTTFTKQSGFYMSAGAPTFPYLITGDILLENYYESILGAFFIMLAIVFCAVFLFISLKQKEKRLSLDLLILLALTITFTLPFFLPSMHSRYFYVAEIFAIIFAFMKPKYFYIPILIMLSSLSTYVGYLFNSDFFDLRYNSLLMFITFVILMFAFYKENKLE